MYIRWNKNKIIKILLSIAFLLLILHIIVPIGYIIIALIFKFVKYLTNVPVEKERFAFITSSYFYEKSESLGDNSLALVMSINNERNLQPWMDMQWWNSDEQSKISIVARNSTTTVVATTKYKKVTPHIVCKMITVFATVQLLPNVQSIAMIGDNGVQEIPFQIPLKYKRDVVVCISPLFVSEQWQNFVLAAHIYKKFGAHMHVYLISAVDSFFHLMKYYESMGDITIQPWVSVKFPGISDDVIDPYNNIEFRNQAASQTDCLLQYKESAQFVTFLDLDDVLIPKLSPTYYEEFLKIVDGGEHISYIHYHKENHDITTVNDGSRFSIDKMFKTLTYTGARETGKIVVIPKNLNYTWIHFPPYMPSGKKNIVTEENVITHLKTIHWQEEHPTISYSETVPKFYNKNSVDIIAVDVLSEIEQDWMRISRSPRLQSILPNLPREHFYGDLVGKCFNEKYYYYHYSGRISEITCPGPHMCEYIQRPDIKCVHVTAKYRIMKQMKPMTYYYATNARFTNKIGCYPH